MPARRRATKNQKRRTTTNATAKAKQYHKKQKKKAEYEPDLPCDERQSLAEKLLLGEELAQYAFGAAGSYLIHL